jgi:Na+-translocating ferredoxin:NAD+ oxidoreductase RnfA subunit
MGKIYSVEQALTDEKNARGIGLAAVVFIASPIAFYIHDMEFLVSARQSAGLYGKAGFMLTLVTAMCMVSPIGLGVYLLSVKRLRRLSKERL